ncbi:hypothetical protein [Amycolatopsis sp. TNS106]|uniref:hypothetical protein n=1 Tax=Amycolatopsis sp. TNS106 TaxID=2861750 RepID=UPI001C565FBB|nr:hypothetical protein [Amycolatopsis sp. TNS106]QXV56880.1 hypothetical protein CVV72_07550 [Amycolatopsis sp. TNS106]
MFRRKIAAVAIAVATGFGLSVTAGTASAGTVTQTCRPYSGPRTVNVTITAPATATSGVPVPVFVKVDGVEPWPNSELSAGSARLVGFLRQGGAGTGEVKIDVLNNPATIPTGGHFSVEGTQQVTFSTPGTVTLGLHRFGKPLTYWWCALPADEQPPVAATVTVN